MVKGTPSALLAGLDPALLTDGQEAVNGTRVREGMQDALAHLRADGVAAHLCLLPAPDGRAVQALRRSLQRGPFDVVMIGAGVRLDEDLSAVLEDLVELVASWQPRPRIAFNANPEDMAEAVRRALHLRPDRRGEPRSGDA